MPASFFIILDLVLARLDEIFSFSNLRFFLFIHPFHANDYVFITFHTIWKNEWTKVSITKTHQNKALILVVYSIKIFISLQIKAPYTFIDCWLLCCLCWNISWTLIHIFANLLLEFCLTKWFLNKYLFSIVFIYMQPMKWPSVAKDFKLLWKLRDEVIAHENMWSLRKKGLILDLKGLLVDRVQYH